MAPAKKKPEANELMIVNDALNEECRIAIIQDNHLEELYTERTATATNVGNIYKGRVTNVESAIQAAFVDFGEGQNGFLHISDLHPRYFPGQERKERVGKKIPRRDRPLMQEALKRGDEVIVQVLKEGLGTKGPTLTSYLSIPGRLLVAMPGMDRVGVSRKVEDDEKRRKMRQILDSLDLPDGFGFILRTAGFGRTKTELKRDVAYLMRLWKLMEQRRKSSKGPCELYTESDLLIRTIRDVYRPTVKAIIVDTDSAWHRATNFLRVAAPRSAPEVIRYHRPTPIFHAYDIERQIELIHSREVPLPAGGKLVIEQTEALVAIDVNSGKSRAAKDSETNAYRTNCEAVDEICRQLRLRDLGGLIIHDLIDMHSRRNRKLIEERFAENLKKDRAKSTILRISEFGLVEMTRQRMRPSLRKSHFITCPHCSGLGELKSPETVGSDAARHIGYLLQFDRIRRVEVVCSPKVASVMLSSKRRELVRLEDGWGKRIDVRVSDAIAADRVDFYAYDDRNADVDIEHLVPPQPPTLKQLEREAAEAEKNRKQQQQPAEQAEREIWREHSDEKESDEAAAASTSEDGQVEDRTKQRRRKKRRRSRTPEQQQKQSSGETTAVETSDTSTTVDAEKPARSKAALSDRSKSQQKQKKTKQQQQRSTREGATSKQQQRRQDADSTVRVHTLAKEIGVKSREIVDLCAEVPEITVKNHMSTVSPNEAETIREMLTPEGTDEARTKEQATSGGTRRRRRRGGKKHAARAARARAREEAKKRAEAAAEESRAADAAAENATTRTSTDAKDDAKSGRSQRSRKRSRSAATDAASDGEGKSQPTVQSDERGVASDTASEEDQSSVQKSARGRGRRKKKTLRKKTTNRKSAQTNGQHMSDADDKQHKQSGEEQSAQAERANDGGEGEGKTPKPKRRLYRNRSRVSSVAREQAERTSDS